MQIRIVSKKIQLLRSYYVPAKRTPEGHLLRGTGRASQKIIASFDKWLDKIPQKVLSKLTDEEIEQLQSWLEEQKEKDRKKDLLAAIELVENYMVRATKGIKEFGPIDRRKAKKLQKACNELSKSLQPKRGRPKKR